MQEQLVRYIKGGFPLIAMQSVEVSRGTTSIVDTIRKWNVELKESTASDVLKQFGYALRIWDVTTGWMKINDDDTQQALAKGSDDPIQALKFLLDEKDRKEVPAAVYIVQNFQFFMEDQLMKPHICQYLINFAKNRIPHRHVLFLGTLPQLPAEVSHLFMTIDFALPDRQELISLARKFDTVLKKKKKSISEQELKKIADSAAGMTAYEAENAFRAAIVSSQGKEIDPMVVQKEKARAVKKLGFLEYEEHDLKITDAGGVENLKLWLKDLAYIYHNMDKARAYGLNPPKGMMATGISGTGKTLIAKILSSMFGIPLFRADIGKVFGSLVGETEKNTMMLFKQIDSVSPCIILLDEIEKSLSGTESSGASDAGVTSRLFGRILEYLQDKKSESFFVATANDISKLPPELLRKGRFDQIWFFDLPTEEEREAIFKIHITKTKRDWKNYDLPRLIKETKGCTGAEIEGFITDAMYKAFAENTEYTTDHILQGVKNTPLLSKTKEKEIDALRKWARGRARIANYAEDKHPAWYTAIEDTIITEKEAQANG